MNGVLDAVTNVNNAVNGVVWGVPALALLAFVGVLMTVLTKVFQVSHFGHWMKKTIGAVFKDKHVTSHTKDKSISQFQSLCTALAATVGTGNIVGVSGAILMGGPGAVFCGPAARCTISATVWAPKRAAQASARCWPFCSPFSASSPPSASAT